MPLKLKWSKDAALQLKSAYEYIKLDSVGNAKKVRQDIGTACELLCVDPNRYPRDKDKIGNDGAFRGFIIYNYKISYKADEFYNFHFTNTTHQYG